MAALNTLEDLTIEHLRDLYSAEEQIIEALPKMIEASSSADLRKAFEAHLKETFVHRERLIAIFDQLKEKPEGHTCKAMKGLIKEAEDFLKEKADPQVRDAGLIAAAQRVEHYEMAGYGCVRTWAKQLKMTDIAKTLQQTLDEEGEADKKLSALAERGLNKKAVE